MLTINIIPLAAKGSRGFFNVFDWRIIKTHKRENPSFCIQRTAAVLEVDSRKVKPMRGFFVGRLGFAIGTEVG